jgi:two-component system chemotaxis response regulator CheV
MFEYCTEYTGEERVTIMDTNILLENGTNELEVLEFTLAGNHYGINVAKIREILTYQPVTPIPNAHPSVEGIFMPRDTMITVINLRNCLALPDIDRDGLFIITNFNKLNIAFHVDEVCGIHRLSWADIITPDATINIEENGVSTGVIKLEDRLIVILDFEKIVTDISPETGLQVSDLEGLEERNRSDSPILIAEDSPLLSKLITDCLKKAGYTKLIVNNNGQEAWDKLCEFQKDGSLDDKVHMVITDIEMPLMDGHRLTKLVKEDEDLKHIPVIIFSSLVNEEMRRKGEMLGADAQLTKPEIGKLVSAIDNLLDERKEKLALKQQQ